jgi:DeoR family transcriptional regulator of aga operon
MLVAELGATMAARARRVVVVADATKLGTAGFTPIVGLDAVHVRVTDGRVDPAFVDQLRRGIDVIVV